MLPSCGSAKWPQRNEAVWRMALRPCWRRATPIHPSDVSQPEGIPGQRSQKHWRSTLRWPWPAHWRRARDALPPWASVFQAMAPGNLRAPTTAGRRQFAGSGQLPPRPPGQSSCLAHRGQTWPIAQREGGIRVGNQPPILRIERSRSHQQDLHGVQRPLTVMKGLCQSGLGVANTGLPGLDQGRCHHMNAERRRPDHGLGWVGD